MKRKRYPASVRATSAIALVILASNCGTDGTPSSGVPSARSGSPHAEGKRLYLTRCTACHAPEPVGKYSADQWRSILPEMATEAKLNPSQTRAVLDYVLSGSE